MTVKHVIGAAVCAALFVLFLWLKIPVWFLCLVGVIYFMYPAFVSKRETHIPIDQETDPPKFGILGVYPMEDDKSDFVYGMYTELGGYPVFISIREDSLIEKRRERALFLHNNRAALEDSLKQFLIENPGFQSRRLHYIGLHAKAVSQGEVFWEPDGYTSLDGLEFRS